MDLENIWMECRYLLSKIFKIAVYYGIIFLLNIVIETNVVVVVIICFAGSVMIGNFIRNIIVDRGRNNLTSSILIGFVSCVAGFVILFYMMRFRLLYLESLSNYYVNRRLETVRILAIFFEVAFCTFWGGVAGIDKGKERVSK